MSKGMEQFEDVDWSSLSASDFESKKSQVFRLTQREAREKKLREDSAYLETETGDDGD